jgi:hypothetical protein
MILVPMIIVILNLVVFSLRSFVEILALVPMTTVKVVFAIMTKLFMTIKTLVLLILVMKPMDLLFIL